ncbi:inosine monophosphate dehydrogenase [Auricularia subglabra TFB-10046 SS5]|nr:inosine monophosphate dehydrogenase [Auricularia subglabra TFB-10046 SS5]
MGGPAGGALAAAVSSAGGFGFIGNTKPTLKFIDEQLAIARGVLQGERLPIGVGFLTWILDEMPAASAEEIVQRAAGQVECIWLSFGDVKRWYDVVRAADREVKIAIVVNSVREAQDAAQWGAEVLIVQGVEAGGHGVANGVPIISLLAIVLDALQPAEKRPVVLAAGGISNGAQAAALLALGADGVIVGTRLLATPEALGYSQAQKEAIVAAAEGSSVRTEIFDIMRGTTGWPKGIDGRALRNKTYDEHIEGRSVDALKADFDKAVTEGDVNRIITWSGSSVGSVKAITPAAEVVREFHQDILASIQRVHSMLQE